MVNIGVIELLVICFGCLLPLVTGGSVWYAVSRHNRGVLWGIIAAVVLLYASCAAVVLFIYLTRRLG